MLDADGGPWFPVPMPPRGLFTVSVVPVKLPADAFAGHYGRYDGGGMSIMQIPAETATTITRRCVRPGLHGGLANRSPATTATCPEDVREFCARLVRG